MYWQDACVNRHRNRIVAPIRLVADMNTAYDENDDGFRFSRSRPKKTQAKTSPPPPSPELLPVEAKASTPPKRRRKKYSFSDSAKKDNEAPKRTRRSARLSGEKEAIDTPVKQSKQVEKVEIPAPGPLSQEEDAAPIVNDVVEPVKWRTPKKIALPFADTPIIRRNKEMRKGNSDEGHRRSSTGMRGRRASSLIDSGTSNGGQLSSTFLIVKFSSFSGNSCASHGCRDVGFLQAHRAKPPRAAQNEAVAYVVRDESFT